MAHEVLNSAILSASLEGHAPLSSQALLSPSQLLHRQQMPGNSRARTILEVVGAGLLLSAVIFSLVRRLQEEARLV